MITNLELILIFQTLIKRIIINHQLTE